MLGAGDFRHHRPATGGDNDAVRRVFIVFDRDRVSVHEFRRPVDRRDAAVAEIALVDAVQGRNVSVAPLLDSRPVVAVDRHVEAVVRRVRRMMHLRGRVPHNLFRYATDVDTSAAQRPVLDDGHLRTVLRRPPRMCDSAAAAADDD